MYIKNNDFECYAQCDYLVSRASASTPSLAQFWEISCSKKGKATQQSAVYLKG